MQRQKECIKGKLLKIVDAIYNGRKIIKKYPRNSSYLSLYQSNITQYPLLPRGWSYCPISRRYDIL